MPKRGVKYAALSIRNGQQHRLMLTGTVGGGIRVCSGQKVDVFRGTAQAVVKLVLGVFPLGRQSLHDGVRRVPSHNHELMAFAVMPSGTGRVFDNQLSVAPACVGTGLLGSITPPP